MKKMVMVILLMFVSIGVVWAKEDILIKQREVSKHFIADGWQSPHRKIFTLGNKYMTYDSYITTSTNDYNKWWGEQHIILTSYNKDWEEVGIKEISIEYGEAVFIADNNFFVYKSAKTKDGYEYEIETYDENFKSNNLKLNYNKVCDENSYNPFCSLTFKDVYQSEDAICYLVYETHDGEILDNDNYRKILKVSNDYKDYSFEDVSEDAIKKMFPQYYYKNINEETKGHDDYYIVDDKVLISGDTLSYYENGVKRFEITNDDYERFGSAKVYNNLIIAIGYINYTPEVYGNDGIDTEMYGLNYSDILFYDLDGELIDVYEHNYYDYDIILDDDNLILTNLYVDGICSVNRYGYYTYNGTCKATLTNEVYSMFEEYLSMSKVNDSTDGKYEHIKNPETLPDVNDVILLGFIALIVLIVVRLIKFNFRKI